MDKIEQAAFVAQFWDGKFPVVIYDIAKAAHRQGWEQAKREADSLLLELIDVVLESKPVLQSARKAITSMEYKETTNGL